MKKKVICTIIVLVLIITPCHRAYADAGTIAITGGSIAVGGAGTIATGAIAGPVVVAVFCGMMAMGMNIELTQASQQAGMTKTQYLKNKLEQYCNEAQITYGVFNNAILNGTTVLQNGAIKLGSQAGTQIKQFVNWLFNSDQVVDSSGSGGVEGNHITLGNYTLPYGNTFSYTNPAGNVITYTTNKPVAWYSVTFFNEQNVTPRCIFPESLAPVSMTIAIDGNTITNNPSSYKSNHYETLYYNSIYNPESFVGLPNVGNSGTFHASLKLDDWVPEMDSPDEGVDHITGSRDAWSSGSSVLDPTQGKSTVINPDLTGSIPIPADTDVTVNIRDYLDALEKVLDGIQAGIVARDKETDIPFTIPIPDETVIDPTIDKEDDEDLPDKDEQTPVTDPDKPVDPEKNPNTSVEPLKFDLKNIFPFCIPFDIKDMLAKLNAEPVAPNYHVDWNIPLLNTSLEFDINLSCWNSVAAVLRKMELLSFIVGLAVLTRNLIRG